MNKRRDRRNETSGGDASTADAIDGETFRRFVDTWMDAAYDRITRRGVSPDAAGAVLTRTFREVRATLPDEAAPVGAVVARAAQEQAGAERSAPPTLSPAETRRAIDRLTKSTDARRAADDEGVATLLWQAAGVFGGRDVEIMDLHWRHKLDAAGVAAVVGGTPDEIGATIAKLPNGFATALRTRVLWGDGRPQDNELAAELTKHGVTTFDAQAVRIIHRHLQGSPGARARSLIPVTPIDAFAAIPMTAAPTTVRKEVVVATTVDTGSAAGPAGAGAAAGAGVLAAGALAADASPAGADVGTDTPDTPVGTDASTTAAAPVSSGSADTSTSDAETVAATGLGAAAGGAAVAGAATGASAAGAEPGPVHTPVTSKREPGTGSDHSKRWLGVGVAAAVLLVALIAFAATRDSGDDGEVDTAATDLSTTTTRPSTSSTSPTTTAVTTTTTEASTTTTAGGVTTTTAGGGANPTVPVAPTTTVPPRTARITSFALNPTTPVRSGYTMGEVTLSWRTEGTPDLVVVSGPDLLSYGTSGGPTAVCPGVVAGPICNVAPGTYQYVIDVTLDGRPVAGSPKFAYLVIRED